MPFGSSSGDPDDPENRPQSQGDEQSGGAQQGGFGFGGMPGMGGGENFDVGQLGQMLSQLGQMLSSSGSSTGPVNYDLAKQIAVQQLTNASGLAGADREQAVADSIHLAEMWLDPVTTLPAGAREVGSWSARDWVEQTLPTWQRLCDPVAQRMSNAWVEALPEQAKQAAGPVIGMLGQMGGMAFGSQLGNAMAQLGSEVLTSSDVGLPLGKRATAALLPANIEQFTEGLERPSSEVMVYLACREAAHQRLFEHVSWLRERLLSTVEEFARGIKIDTSALEDLASQIDPNNPQSIEQAMSSGMLEPQQSPEQQAALNRLETLLALVEGWVDVVVTEAVGERLPGAEALRETLRRRRASGGPAEQTFATLVGLELRPRKLRAASALWKMLGDQLGTEERDRVWSHPDLLPGAEDLDNPTDFVDRRAGKETAEGEFAVPDDPIAALEQTERAERATKRDEPEREDATGDEGAANSDGTPNSEGASNSGGTSDSQASSSEDAEDRERGQDGEDGRTQ